jgi:hypothetical protein
MDARGVADRQTREGDVNAEPIVQVVRTSRGWLRLTYTPTYPPMITVTRFGSRGWQGPAGSALDEDRSDDHLADLLRTELRLPRRQATALGASFIAGARSRADAVPRGERRTLTLILGAVVGLFFVVIPVTLIAVLGVGVWLLVRFAT